jgi:fatty-acyl-CoA synthase
MDNISNWIDAHARFTPNKLAIIYQQRQCTYADLAQAISANAKMLKQSLGIGRGDRVAYLGLNDIELISVLFACARLGAIFVPLNWRLETPEYDYMLADASPKALLVTPDFQQQVASLAPAHPACAFVLQDTQLQQHQQQPSKSLLNAHLWRSYSALLQSVANQASKVNHANLDLSAPVLIVYTSGTTGYPKGAVLTQNALFYNALNSQHMHQMTSSDTILTVLPMFHVGGLNIQTLPALYVGATVLLHARFDPQDTLAAIQQQKPSLTVLVPATLWAMLAQPHWLTTDLSSLRSITSGSSLVPTDLIAAVTSRGLPVQQVYGLTETSPIAVYQTAQQAKTRFHSTGLSALHCQMKLTGPKGLPVALGEVGHILIKGPNVLFEYWGNPEATALALQNGWFDTGDLGHLDVDGHLIVDDRAKDMIISGGENIYPAQLEGHLHGLDGVIEAAVVGRKDPKWGETPIALVVLAPKSTLNSAAILQSFVGQLARFKHPSEVVFIPKLPRNVMGKVQKFLLREMIDSQETK